jgi:hypothetical protein
LGATPQKTHTASPRRSPWKYSSEPNAALLHPGWADALDGLQLATVTSVQKTRQLDDDGKPRTVQKVMATSRGHIYQLDAPLVDRTGAHGRIHAARAISGPDGNLIIKVQRTQRKLAGKQDVLDAPLEDLLRSAAASKLATDHVDMGLEERVGLFEGNTAPLRGLGASQRPCSTISWMPQESTIRSCRPWRETSQM